MPLAGVEPAGSSTVSQRRQRSWEVRPREIDQLAAARHLLLRCPSACRTGAYVHSHDRTARTAQYKSARNLRYGTASHLRQAGRRRVRRKHHRQNGVVPSRYRRRRWLSRVPGERHKWHHRPGYYPILRFARTSRPRKSQRQRCIAVISHCLATSWDFPWARRIGLRSRRRTATRFVGVFRTTTCPRWMGFCGSSKRHRETKDSRQVRKEDDGSQHAPSLGQNCLCF
ncbi:MAG: hypothetical protein KatS3mg105_2292 [Gemmatales bacterium]|nr:MAG: hypothetical protein KatS3mg105_2292 [Gemmatales bacterium]